MSLIDEALKRARMEAAQRAAENEGLPYPTIPRHLGRRPRRAWLAPAVVALAVVAGLGIGWWFASSKRVSESVAPLGGAAAEAEAAPPTAGPATPEQVTRDPVPDLREAGEPAGSAPSGIAAENTPPAAPEPLGPQPVTSGPAEPEDLVRDTEAREPQRPDAADAPTPEGRPAPPRARPPAEAPSPATRPEPPPAEPAAAEAPPSRLRAAPPARPAPAPPQQPAAITDPDSGVLLELPERQSRDGDGVDQPAGDSLSEIPAETHAQQYPLAGGGAIELAGIAWSETGPFALINGRVVSPGATIEGYTLERIRPGHVILTGDGRRIHLSLR